MHHLEKSSMFCETFLNKLLLFCYPTNFPVFLLCFSEWRDETLWSARDKTKDKYYKDKPYYGIKGMQRISNKYIAAGCVVFMLVGAAFHFVIVK
jgi:hypothetical protein